MLPMHVVVQCSACAVATPIPSNVARVRQIPRVFIGSTGPLQWRRKCRSRPAPRNGRTAELSSRKFDSVEFGPFGAGYGIAAAGFAVFGDGHCDVVQAVTGQGILEEYAAVVAVLRRICLTATVGIRTLREIVGVSRVGSLAKLRDNFLTAVFAKERSLEHVSIHFKSPQYKRHKRRRSPTCRRGSRKAQLKAGKGADTRRQLGCGSGIPGVAALTSTSSVSASSS